MRYLQEIFHTNKNFILLLIGQIISVIGERISTLVFFSLAVTITGTNSSFFASVLVAIQFIPLFLFGYFFGLLCDVVNKKFLLIVADIARLLAILLLIFNQNSLILLYTVVFLIGLFTSLFQPAKKSLIPFIVEEKKLVELNKIFASSEIIGIFIGLLIGTIILEFVSITQALFINATTYFISFLLIIFITYKTNKKKHFDEYDSFSIENLKKGFKYLQKNYQARQVVLNITIINFLAAGLNYAAISDYSIRNATGIDPGSQVGSYLLAIALGAILTPIANKYTKKFKESSLISILFLSGGSIFSVLAILMSFDLMSYELLYPIFFVTGIFVGLIYTRILYLLHTTTSKKFMGRVISIDDLLSSLMIIVGILLGGLINEYFTYKIGFLVTGLVFGSGFFFFLLTKKKLTW